MRVRTYTPLPSWPPAVLAVAVLVAGYVIGPFIGSRLSATAARVLIAVDDALADTPTTD